MKENPVLHQESSLDSEALLDFQRAAEGQPEQSRFARTVARWWFRSRPLHCPACKSTVICRSQRHGIHEKLLKSFRIVPWRCMECSDRFFALTRKIDSAKSS
jgi:hypothetical protein